MSPKDLSLKETIEILDKVKSLLPGTSQCKIAEKLCTLKSNDCETAQRRKHFIKNSI